MREIVIKAENLTLEYRKTSEKIQTLKEYLIRVLKKNIKYESFLALNDVSFEISKGERVGIIGPNGAGKSTLMKLIAEVLKPTKGSIAISGAVAPMLELGAGFDEEFSGYDNIFLNGAILGKSKEYLESHLDEIIKFADLGDFIYSPVKNYSSGMRAKLGFAVATQIEPDVLIIDEVLGVGDVRFREKSANRVEELINGGATSVIVSHSIDQILRLTDKTMWIDSGKIMIFDRTEKVCEAYLKFMSK